MDTFRVFFLDHRSCYLKSLGDALAQIGNSVFYQSSWDFNEIESNIRRFKPHLLITVGSDVPHVRFPMEEIPKLCRKYNIFHLYWATEDLIHHETWSIPFIQRIQPNYVWTIHGDCVERYKQIGIPADYFNFAFNPRMFPIKKKLATEKYDISFVGHTHLGVKTFRYDSIRQLIVPLINGGQQVNIWGYGWKEKRNFIEEQFQMNLPEKNLHGSLPYEQTGEIYCATKIMLGIQNAMDQLTQRTFEIMGCGSFMVASFTDELHRLFQRDHDLVLVKNPDETPEIIKYYMKRPELRFQIGLNARKVVLAHHTFSHRFQKTWPALVACINKGGGL